MFLITLVQRDEDGQAPGRAALCFGHTRQEQGRQDEDHLSQLETPHIAGTMLFFPVSSQHPTSTLGAVGPLSSSCFPKVLGLNLELAPTTPGLHTHLPGKPWPRLFSLLILPPPGKSDSDMVSESVIKMPCPNSRP